MSDKVGEEAPRDDTVGEAVSRVACGDIYVFDTDACIEADVCHVVVWLDNLARPFELRLGVDVRVVSECPFSEVVVVGV